MWCSEPGKVAGSRLQCSAVPLICCSINTETKPDPAKITIGALFRENWIAEVCYRGINIPLYTSEGKLSKTKEYVHGNRVLVILIAGVGTDHTAYFIFQNKLYCNMKVIP